MNIQALAADIKAALVTHGVAGVEQNTLAAMVALATTEGGAALMRRVTAGATLFAVDDAGTIALSAATRTPINAWLLHRVMQAVSPQQFRQQLEMFLSELGDIVNTCSCPECVARRASNSLNCIPEPTDCRSKH